MKQRIINVYHFKNAAGSNYRLIAVGLLAAADEHNITAHNNLQEIYIGLHRLTL
jgi:hypothetical protein